MRLAPCLTLLVATTVLAEEPRLTFRGRLAENEASPVVAVAGSADGKRIAVAREDGTVVLDAATREVTHRLRRADQLAFTPDGSFLVHSRDDEVATYELAGGVPRSLPVRGELWALRDDTLAVVGSRTIHLLDVKTGAVARSFPIEPLPIEQERPVAVTFTSDGRVAIRRCAGAVVYEGNGELTRLADFDELSKRVPELGVARCAHASRSAGVRVTNDGRQAVAIPDTALPPTWTPAAVALVGTDRVVSVSGRGPPRVFDARRWTELASPVGHWAPIVGLAFSGDVLAAACEESRVSTWNVATGRRRMLEHGSRAVAASSSAVFAGDPGAPLLGASPGGQVARRNDDGSVAVIGSNGAHLDRIAVRYKAVAVAWSPDERWLAVAAEDASVTLAGPGGHETLSLPEGSGLAVSVAFSSDGGLVAVGTREGEVHVVSVAAREVARTYRRHLRRGGSCSVAFLPAGIVVARADREVAFVEHIEVATGRVAPLAIPGARVLRVASSGDLLACGHEDGEVSLWELR